MFYPLYNDNGCGIIYDPAHGMSRHITMRDAMSGLEVVDAVTGQAPFAAMVVALRTSSILQ